MSDNTEIKNASGGTELIADDEITDETSVAVGAKVQRAKLGFGDDGSYVDVAEGSSPLPVKIDMPFTGQSDSPFWVSVAAAGDPLPVVTLDPDPTNSGYIGNLDDTFPTPIGSGGAFNVTVYDSGGPWVGTIAFEGTNDPINSTWNPLSVRDLSTGDVVTQTSANGQFIGNAEYLYVRAHATAWTSGEAIVAVQWRHSPPQQQATVDGAVDVANWPATQPVSLAAPVPVTDNGGSLTVDGTVNVGNFPAAQPVTDNGGSLTVDGTVSVGNFPATQPVSLAAPVPVTDNGGSLTVDGTVGVSGTVTVDTELPAAAALADNVANPTTTQVGAANEVWSGSSWERARSWSAVSGQASITGVPAAGLTGYDFINGVHRKVTTDANGSLMGPFLEVAGTMAALNAVAFTSDVRGYARWSLQLTGLSGIVTVQVSNDLVNWIDYTNVWYVGTANAPTQALGAGITSNGMYHGSITSKFLRVIKSAHTSGTATATMLVMSQPGIASVSAQTSLPAPAAPTDSTSNLSVPTVASDPMVFNGSGWDRQRSFGVTGAVGVSNVAGTSGGWSAFSNNALSTTVQAVKTSAGQFGGYMIYNPHATAVAHVQVFNTSSVTLGTTVPMYVLSIPPASAANLELTCGVAHSNGIWLAATAGPASNGAPSSALVATIFYK